MYSITQSHSIATRPDAFHSAIQVDSTAMIIVPPGFSTGESKERAMHPKRRSSFFVDKDDIVMERANVACERLKHSYSGQMPLAALIDAAQSHSTPAER